MIRMNVSPVQQSRETCTGRFPSLPLPPHRHYHHTATTTTTIHARPLHELTCNKWYACAGGGVVVRGKGLELLHACAWMTVAEKMCACVQKFCICDRTTTTKRVFGSNRSCSVRLTEHLNAKMADTTWSLIERLEKKNFLTLLRTQGKYKWCRKCALCFFQSFTRIRVHTCTQSPFSPQSCVFVFWLSTSLCFTLFPDLTGVRQHLEADCGDSDDDTNGKIGNDKYAIDSRQ